MLNPGPILSLQPTFVLNKVLFSERFHKEGGKKTKGEKKKGEKKKKEALDTVAQLVSERQKMLRGQFRCQLFQLIG